uniref:Aurora kinase n=1 Tax=Rhabditophanes sp. KR3021 TaxID=114890 RepID=A0AC35TS76_9BILA
MTENSPHIGEEKWVDEAQEKLYQEFIKSNILSKNRHQSINEFSLGPIIGKGGFGIVYKIKHKQTNQLYAMKVIFTKNMIKSNLAHQLRREIGIQQAIRHKNILRLYSVLIDSNKFLLITEYCHHGSLFSLLQKAQKLPIVVACSFFYETVGAVIYLHEHRILHRDIKTENLLITVDYHIKLADFGWAVYNKNAGIIRQSTICGTLEYLPPEMLKNKRNYTKEVDNWALGILLYEMLIGHAPFSATEGKENFSRIVRDQAVELPPDMDPDAVVLIEGLLQKDATKRLNLEKIQESAFIQKHIGDIINQDYKPRV